MSPAKRGIPEIGSMPTLAIISPIRPDRSVRRGSTPATPPIVAKAMT